MGELLLLRNEQYAMGHNTPDSKIKVFTSGFIFNEALTLKFLTEMFAFFFLPIQCYQMAEYDIISEYSVNITKKTM